MKATLFLVAASAAAVSAQAKLNDDTRKWECSKANASFCSVDGSMMTDLIVHCDGNKVGRAGRCSDNTAGREPIGNKQALCYQKDATSGTAGCAKQCVVYENTGNSGPTFTLTPEQCHPNQSPVSSNAGSSSASASSSSSSSGYSEGKPPASSTSDSSSDTSSATTTTFSASASLTIPTTTVTTATGGGYSAASGNDTIPATTTSEDGDSATNTPVAPTTPSSDTTPTPSASDTATASAAASANQAVGAVAGLGLLAAYLL